MSMRDVCIAICVVQALGLNLPKRVCMDLVAAVSFYSTRQGNYKKTWGQHVALRWLEPYYNI
jgi:hypothetical protein